MKGSRIQPNRRHTIVKFMCIVVIFGGILAVAVGLSSCSQGRNSRKPETVTIAAPSLEQNALLYVASEKGIFAKNGLKITIKDYDSGATAINGMMKGEADIAEAAEFPFVRAALKKEQIRIIACNDKFENASIIGRKDRGIADTADLKGKKIGLARGTIAEFYLGRFLEVHGMKLQDITLVDVKPAQFATAIADGSVDAIVAWQPYAQQIQDKQATGVVVWPASNDQPAYGILVSGNEWLAHHRDTAGHFLKSLVDAEHYLIHHPHEAKAIVQKRLDYSDSYITSVWPRHQFSVSLDFSLIAALNDEAHWMIRNNLTTEKQVPDFMDYIYLDGLKEVKPEAVNIVR